MFNNREISLMVWVAVALMWILSSRDLRSQIGGLVRQAMAPALIGAWLAMTFYVVAVVIAAERVGLWEVSLLKATLSWLGGTALVLFLSMNKVGEKGFARRTVSSTVKFTVFLSYLLNLYVFDLWIELMLQPILAALLLMHEFLKTSPEHAPARRYVDGLLIIIVLTVSTFYFVQVIRKWEDVAIAENAVSLALPIWLTVSLLPFIYILGLSSAYGSAFSRVRWARRPKKLPVATRLAMVGGLRLRIRDVNAFVYPWYRQAAEASSWREAHKVMRAFKLSRVQRRTPA